MEAKEYRLPNYGEYAFKLRTLVEDGWKGKG